MNNGQNNDKKPAGFPSIWAGIYWWTFLTVAVLAVPAVGFLFAMIIPDKNIGQLLVFVLTCWLCTYLGMRLMKK